MKQAPSAKHGKHYKKNHRKHATNDKDFKLFNMINQTPEMAARTAANVDYRQMFSTQSTQEQRRVGYLATCQTPEWLAEMTDTEITWRERTRVISKDWRRL